MPTAGLRRSSSRSRQTNFYGYPESHRQEINFINIGIHRMSTAKKKAAEAGPEGDQPSVFLALFFCL
jgi:hypothetical protein